jgi:RNA-directed DNA polymerase
MPEESCIDRLQSSDFWTAFLGDIGDKSRGSREKFESYTEIVESGAILDATRDVLNGTFIFNPPIRHYINKIDTSKKKIVYTFPPLEELFLKGVNAVLQELLEEYISPLCHSFRKGRGAKSAFRSIFRDSGIDSKFCLRLDIKNYFNNVNVDHFFASLPGSVLSDGPVMFVLKSILTDKRVIWDREEQVDNAKGLMAGTPVAPLLSNIYLRELDEIFRVEGATYVRYSDDIIMFADRDKFDKYREIILDYLGGCGLEINPGKTFLKGPGEPWEYLGFRYETGTVDISNITLEKAKGKIRRLANRYDNFRKWKQASADDAVSRIIRRINRKYFGYPDDGDLCWSQWFFPVITTSETLKELDGFIQDKLRFVACGKYSKRAFKVMPYSKMKELGYMPLTAAYYIYREDPAGFFEVIRNE